MREYSFPGIYGTGEKRTGATEGKGSRQEAPAGRLLYDEIVLMPVKGSDDAGSAFLGGAP